MRNDDSKFSLFSKKKAPEVDASQLKIPVHLAVIMDGNGRWAKSVCFPVRPGIVPGRTI